MVPRRKLHFQFCGCVRWPSLPRTSNLDRVSGAHSVSGVPAAKRPGHRRSLKSEKHAAYIAEQFRSFGLQPLEGKKRRRRQEFSELAFRAELGAKLGPTTHFLFATASPKRVCAKARTSYPSPFRPTENSTGKWSLPAMESPTRSTTTTTTPESTSRTNWVLILRHEPQERPTKFFVRRQTPHLPRDLHRQDDGREESRGARRDPGQRHPGACRRSRTSWRS